MEGPINKLSLTFLVIYLLNYTPQFSQSVQKSISLVRMVTGYIFTYLLQYTYAPKLLQIYVRKTHPPRRYVLTRKPHAIPFVAPSQWQFTRWTTNDDKKRKRTCSSALYGISGDSFRQMCLFHSMCVDMRMFESKIVSFFVCLCVNDFKISMKFSLKRTFHDDNHLAFLFFLFTHQPNVDKH